MNYLFASSVKTTTIFLVLASSIFSLSGCATGLGRALAGPSTEERKASWLKVQEKLKARDAARRADFERIERENPSWNKAISDDIILIQCSEDGKELTCAAK